MKKPKKPKEPRDAIALRQRQIQELAKLDEEENRRIKAMFRGRQGGRAFRSAGSSKTAGNAAGAAFSAGGGGGGGSYGGGGGGGSRPRSRNQVV